MFLLGRPSLGVGGWCVTRWPRPSASTVSGSMLVCVLWFERFATHSMFMQSRPSPGAGWWCMTRWPRPSASTVSGSMLFVSYGLIGLGLMACSCWVDPVLVLVGGA